jgi:hypothetical protein
MENIGLLIRKIVFDASIVCFFRFTGKITSRQFAIFTMVCNALAAQTFSAAWIRTVAVFYVGTFFALHIFLG